MVYCRPNSVSFITKVRGGEEKREGGFERYLGGPGDCFQVADLIG